MTYLHDRHRRELAEDSGISAEVIAARGYRSVGADELRALGFAPSQCRSGGLLIPLWSTAGVQTDFMVKLDNPRTDEHGKPLKYEVPAGSSPMIDCPPAMTAKLRDPAVPLYFSEGSKKADNAATHGLACVSLGGVYGFLQHKQVIADLDDVALIGRRVILAFDSDVTTKPEVADARNRLGSALWRRGAKVDVVTLPPGPNREKVGLDDFLAAGNTVADLDALTTTWHREAIEPPELVQLRAERDQLISDNAALLRAQANPYIKQNEKTMLASLLIVAANKPGAAPGATVRLSADEIAHDFRKEPEKKGERVAPFNKDGSRPRMARGQVKSLLTSAMERGLLTVKPQPARVERKDGSFYERTEWEFTLPSSVADYMKPAALFEPPESTPRKPRRLDACVHCNEIHDVKRMDVCTGCGQVRHTQIIKAAVAEEAPDKISGVTEGGMSLDSEPIEPSSSGPTLDNPDDLSGVPSKDAAPIEQARADLIRRRAASEAHPALAAADDAGDADDLHQATADLAAALEPIGRARGVIPNPKPTSSWDTPPPDYDYYDYWTDPPLGAAP